jgi:hypothetical protein
MVKLLTDNTSYKVLAMNEEVKTFPTLKVDIPETGRERDSMGSSYKVDRSGTLRVEVIADDMKQMLDTIEEVESLIENNWPSYLQIPTIGTSSASYITVGNKDIIIKSIPISFMKK